MKLLFDQNLSRRLVAALRDLFPDSSHVATEGMARADDRSIWSYAAAHDFVIVSKDSDFSELSFLYGAPPKAVWLRIGNASTAMVAEVLRANVARLVQFGSDGSDSFLVLTREDIADKPH